MKEDEERELLHDASIDPEIWKRLCKDGQHFTLYKFSTNWRCALGTIAAIDDLEHRMRIDVLPAALTANGAIVAAIAYYESTDHD